MATSAKSSSTTVQKSVLLNSNGFKYHKNVSDHEDEDDYLSQKHNSMYGKSSKPDLKAIVSYGHQKAVTTARSTKSNDVVRMDKFLNQLNQIDITDGLDLLGFEAGLKNEEEVLLSRQIRLRCHASYVYACAQAAYFVGNANKLRRNINAIMTNEIKPQHMLLLDEMQSVPGLRIGIIGGGRLCRQLAQALLEYGGVKPEELHISTRQPDTLHELKSLGVECQFGNRDITTKVNILFICVLASQLQEVIDEIKHHIPKKCIIYSFVRTIPIKRLRNLIDAEGETLLIKPNYEFNVDNEMESIKKWNFTLNIIESLNNHSVLELTNPLSESPDKIMNNDIHFVPTIVYALIDICVFLKFNKSQTIAALSGYVFNTTFEKKYSFDETLFFTKTDSDFFTITNLIKVATGPSRFSNELEKRGELYTILKENYFEYFDNIYKWKHYTYKAN